MIQNNQLILCGNNQAGINVNTLASIFNVPAKTITNNYSLFKNNSHSAWTFVQHSKVRFVLNIPCKTRKRYSIPYSYEEILERIRNHENIIHLPDRSEEILQSELKLYCDENWPRVIGNYDHNPLLKRADREKLAYIESALLFVNFKSLAGIDSDVLHRIIVQNSLLNPSDSDNYEKNILKLDFNPGSGKRYFLEKVRKGLRFGFYSILVHKNLGKESKRKLSKDTVELTKALVCSEQNYKLATATRELKNNGVKISYRSVRRIQKKHKKLAEIGNRGLDDANINAMPFVIGIKPENPGDYAEADATKDPILCRTTSGNLEFYKSYTIIDGHSGLPTGCVGPSENEILVMTSWKLFVKEHGFMPREIRYDGGPGHKGKRFQELIKSSGALGVIWRPSHQSTELSIVERYHHTLDTTVHNGKKYYVGEGIKSKSKRNRPSNAVIKAYRNDPNVPTTEQLRKLYYDYQHEFRNQVISTTDKGLFTRSSPNNKWHSKDAVNAVQVNAVQFIMLFGNKVGAQFRKGMISFTPNKDGRGVKYPLYSYSIYEPNLFLKVGSESDDLIVRYDLEDMTKAYLFTKDDVFISKILPTPKVSKTHFNHTEKDMSNLTMHRKGKRNLNKEIKKQLNELKELEEQFNERKVPIQILSHHDDKDTHARSTREYFLELSENVETETLKKRSMKEGLLVSDSYIPTSMCVSAKQNAENYN